MAGLTHKQEAFAQAVASGKTYSDAYREAYDCKKMSVNSIYVKSSELMNNGKVTVRVKEIQEETRDRNKVVLDEVLKEMANWLRFDPIELFDENYALKSIADLPPQVRKTIASMEVVELYENIDKVKTKVGELKKVKFIDKRAISDQFMKHFGAYVTKVTHEIEDLSHLEDLLKGINE